MCKVFLSSTPLTKLEVVVTPTSNVTNEDKVNILKDESRHDAYWWHQVYSSWQPSCQQRQAQFIDVSPLPLSPLSFP